MQQLKPKEIVEKLDKFIVGQHDAKRSVAIALRNRWRRNQADESIRNEIMPNNIIMIGPTGVGKTEIARRLAGLAQAPFIKVEATKFTEVGYVGRDVESIIRDLTEIAVKLVEDEVTENLREASEEKTRALIMNILIPHNLEKGLNDKEKKSFEKMKKNLANKYDNGELDDKLISIAVQGPSGGPPRMFSVDEGMNELLEELSTAFTSRAGKKTNREVTIGEAKNILFQQEIEDIIDKNKIVEEALKRTQSHGIVFIDEIDKIASPEGSRGIDVSRQGVQRDLLPIVEGSTVKTRYGFVKTDHILFIASGAFHSSKPSDLIPELQGRFPIRVELNSLSTEDFIKILVNTQNAPIKQYQHLLKTEEVELLFEESAIDTIAEKATELNEKIENIGARRLHTILTKVLEDVMFDAPDCGKQVTITKNTVEKSLEDISSKTDLSKYIL